MKQEVNTAPVKRTKLATLGLLLLACLTAGFGGGWIGARAQDQQSPGQITKANTQVILNESQLINDIAKTAGESVVSVNVIGTATQQSPFGFINEYQTAGAGTGVVLSEDGYVLTNRHVVPNGTSGISITLSDGTELNDVEVIGRTAASDPLDIAFLKIKDKKEKTLKPAKIGDSSKIQVGDKVIAIGNALGQFQNTVTSGIISGYGRSVEAADGSTVESLQNLFQTDAAINEGNSGGPLVNINGEVIGINTAIAGGAQNIGFAIPINDVQALITSVLTKGKLERPYLGVRYVSLTDDYAYEYNLPVRRGAYILPSRSGAASILPDSPAEKAGLKEKDIITKIDGTDVNEKNSLVSLIGRKNVGDEVSLQVIRDGNEQTIKVRLEAAPTD